MTIENKNPVIKLDKFRLLHAEKTYTWITDPYIKKNFIIQRDITWEEHIKYCEKVEVDQTQYYYAIYFQEEHVGNAGLKNMKTAEREAEAWVYIGDKNCRGHGIGTQAFNALLYIAQSKLALETIIVHVAGLNQRALRMYQKLGFIETGEPSSEWENQTCKMIRMEKSLAPAGALNWNQAK